jgi:hypothetical protein
VWVQRQEFLVCHHAQIVTASLLPASPACCRFVLFHGRHMPAMR